MTEKKSMYAETIEKKRERERDELFFFCLLSKCSIRLFFHRAQVKKKVEKKRRVVFNSSNTILSFSVICVCVCSSSSPFSLFFLYIYARIWRLQTYINASKNRKTEKKEKKNTRPKTNGKHTNSFMLSQY